MVSRQIVHYFCDILNYNSVTTHSFYCRDSNFCSIVLLLFKALKIASLFSRDCTHTTTIFRSGLCCYGQKHIHLWHILVAIKPGQNLFCVQDNLCCREKSGLCPHLCAKLYCHILLSSMFKIYEANIIYFHFCIIPDSPSHSFMAVDQK